MTTTGFIHSWPRALTLAERAAARHQQAAPAPLPARGPGVESPRLRKWRSQHPFDRPGLLTRRLEVESLTEADFAAMLADAPEALCLTEPEWVADIERASAAAAETFSQGGGSALHGNEVAGAFEPARAFVAPFVVTALRRLYGQVCHIVSAAPEAPFSADDAVRLLEPSLWSQLLHRAMKVVVLELNVARVRGTLSGETPEARCADFARQLRDGPLRGDLLAEYPVLGRSLATACANWARFSAELLTNLAADHGAVRDILLEGRDPGVLTELSVGAGDPHRAGRAVAIATFSSGARVVYKPRPLDVDVHFAELVHWLNDHGQAPALRAVRTLTVGDHGWAEFVDTAACATATDAGLFYARLGGFLAVLHALEAADFHFENVIAAGEHPMLVDLEALFHPRPELSEPPDDPQWLGWLAVQRSVLRAGVLPFRAYANEESAGLDVSAVGGSDGQHTPNRVPVLENPGTDEMRFARDYVRLPGAKNRPTLGGGPIDPAAYGSQLLAGFTATYRLLVRQRDALLAPDGPIHRFANDTIRAVLRPTRHYALLLSESHHPDVLRDALDRDRLFDRLWVALPGRPDLERIVRFEHAALTAGDVPLFTSSPARRDLVTPDGTRIEQYFERSGLDAAVTRIGAMNEEDLARQQWIIRASLVALVPGAHDTAPSVLPRATLPSQEHHGPVTASACLDAATRVGDRLTQLALRRGEDRCWLGLALLHERDWAIQPIGVDLYGGTMGVALFLAYLDRVVGHAEARDTARSIVRRVVRQVTATLQTGRATDPLPTGSIGAFGLFGGTVYTLAHLGALWRDDDLFDAAHAIVAGVGERVQHDVDLDVIGGAAGFILAANALHQVRPGGHTLEAMRTAAGHLMSRAEPRRHGNAWTTAIESWEPLTGLSHGASGIALALLVAARNRDDDRLVECALGALRYERSTLDPERVNWPDFRVLNGRGGGLRARTEVPSFMCTWCHGAPGIGLARLVALAEGHGNASPELVADLDIALRATAEVGFGANDSLCHGDLGNLELLVRARELGHRGEWEATLDREATRLVDRLARGEWRCGVPGGVETPGLMTGLAGIGYGLLRLGATALVPSVLSLEPPHVSLGTRTRG